MRLGLRGKILLFTVPPLLSLTLASLWRVDQDVSEQVHRQVRDDLQRASASFENMLRARAGALAVEGGVIVRDPKFFSVVSLPASWKDEQFRATVAGVAADFERITRADVFAVLDARGHVLASVGRYALSPEWLASTAANGHTESWAVGEGGIQLQVVGTPVLADGRVVGLLVLGTAVDGALARDLRELSRSEVTFLVDGRATGTTLQEPADLAAAHAAALASERSARRGEPPPGVHEHAAGGDTWLAVARPLPDSPVAVRHGYVMQRSLRDETAVLRRIHTGLLALGLVAVALALAAGLVIAQRITSPIDRIVRAAEAMERGDYDFPLEARGSDEVSYLAERFVDMRAQQRKVVESLQESMRVKREFLSVASHELRTPITVIQGFQELFGGGALGPVSDAQRRALEAIGRSVSTLSRIAEDATRMAQISEDRLVLERERQDLEPILRGAVADALAEARGRAVRVECAISAGAVFADVDGARLRDAVGHLVRNGIRFTPDGGQVLVWARSDERQLYIEVRDTGVGIPPRRLEQLLERQSPVRDSANHHSSNTLEFNSAGLGLGLSIARGIARAHDGWLRAESRENQGSTFTLVLPAVQSPGAAAA
ncbi:MAG: HAMP domain-containing protein [Candidatus Eisenbacteria bacterium]|nr:HAMP domain-containing protein [Candidatus Eisenbacteria bacterium]